MSVRQGSGEGLRRQRLLGGRSSGFVQRSEAHLARHGRANAASLSRVAEPMLDVGEVEDGDEVDDDGGRSTMSKVSRTPSVAPSLHPSMAGSVRSMACSEVTVGAGDRTECASAAPRLRHRSCCMLHPTPQSRCRCGRGEPSPGADVGRQRDSTRRPSTSCMLRGVLRADWDFQHRLVQRTDLGHRCRECSQPFAKIGEALTERRRARCRMLYAVRCALCSTLYAVRCTLCVIRWTLRVVCCSLYAVRCTLYAARCASYAVRRMLYAVRCALCAVRCTLYFVRRAHREGTCLCD